MKRALLVIIILVTIIGIAVYLSNRENTTTKVASTETQKSAEAIRYEAYMSKKKAKHDKGLGGKKMDAPDMFAALIEQRRTPMDREAPEYKTGYLQEEYKLMQQTGHVRRADDDVTFTSRGATNIAGRTRTLLIDPRNPFGNTWFAGAVGGGIWKTTNGGASWANLTPDAPNIAISSLAWSPNNYDVIYAGTGEPFGTFNVVNGIGLLKSDDGGDTWSTVVDIEALPDFVNVSRVVVHPEDENTVWAATTNTTNEHNFVMRTAIYKSTDGGATWTSTLSLNGRLQDLDMSPFNSNILMTTLNGIGVYISMDGGDTWSLSLNGFDGSIGRLEITPSQTDSTRWWISAETRNQGILYVSDDIGQSWQRVETRLNDSNEVDFLGAQGWYDNVITAHPFDNNSVYVGGIDLFKFEVSDEVIDSTISLSFESVGTNSFLSYFNFRGDAAGFIDYGSIPVQDLPRIEVRFGQGGQKAHRFTVGGRGSGVPAAEYVYEDYVDVPFQVWDTDNNRQLMTSFRDQDENGFFDLIGSKILGEPINHSREYLYIHLLDYSEMPNSNVATMGGVSYEQAYFIWPVSSSIEEVDLNAVNPSYIAMDHENFSVLSSSGEVISDAYFSYGGNNISQVVDFHELIGNHPDQHFIHTHVVNKSNQVFRLIIGNDGGVYVSDPDVNPGTEDHTITFASNGYITTQYYGADKAPGVDRYIGGMQDNNTWFTGELTDASGPHDYEFAFGGDGFEVIWNNVRPSVMWGTSQFNNLLVSLDGGKIWRSGTVNLGDVGEFNAPFYSKIATSKQIPEHIYIVSPSGIWKTDYYLQGGRGWRLTVPDGNWAYANSATDIEVSKANPHVIVAGGFLSETDALHVSIDGGESFVETGTYREVPLGYISGIESHPTDENTIYALFSFADRPKVLKSTDLGMTWEDISGFADGSGSSDRGFPDVGVNALFVFPNNTDRIWVGTEIGIVESMDNGASWKLLNCEMGAAPVWELKQQDNQIVIATHGRGIWTATIEDYVHDLVLYPDIFQVNVNPFGGDDNLIINAQQEYDSLAVVVYDSGVWLESMPLSAGFWPISVDEETFGTLLEKNNVAQVVGFVDGEPYISLPYLFDDIEAPDTIITSYFNDFADVETSIMEFNGDLTIGSADGFNGNGIQSEHPYSNNEIRIYQLKYPVAVEDQILSYEDVALVEPGEEDAEFGDDRFWDFVVIEGLAKGSDEWVPLFDGYDARDREAWLEAYSNGEAGSQELLSFHSVPLTDVFESGDTILLRLRMWSEEVISSWGWFIDYLSIESITTSTEELENAELSIYPNPVSNLLTIDAIDDAEISELTIMDISGKVLFSQNYFNTQKREQVNVQSYPSGIYLVRVQTADAREVVKKIIVQ